MELWSRGLELESGSRVTVRVVVRVVVRAGLCQGSSRSDSLGLLKRGTERSLKIQGRDLTEQRLDGTLFRVTPKHTEAHRTHHLNVRSAVGGRRSAVGGWRLKVGGRWRKRQWFHYARVRGRRACKRARAQQSPPSPPPVIPPTSCNIATVLLRCLTAPLLH